jgi:hypothetical protein
MEDARWKMAWAAHRWHHGSYARRRRLICGACANDARTMESGTLPAAIDSCAALQSNPGILLQFLVWSGVVWCGVVRSGVVRSGRTNTGMHHLIISYHFARLPTPSRNRRLLWQPPPARFLHVTRRAAVSRLQPCLAPTRDTVSAWQTAEMSHQSCFQPARVDATRQETTPTSPASSNGAPSATCAAALCPP